MKKSRLDKDNFDGLVFLGIALLISFAFFFMGCRATDEWQRAVWFAIAAVMLVISILIFIFAVSPALGWPAIDQYSRGEGYKIKTKLVKYFNKSQVSEIIITLKEYDEDKLKEVQFYIKSQTITTQHAIQWQNAIPAMIGTFVLPLTIAGIIASQNYNEQIGKVLIVLLIMSFVIIFCLTLFQLKRRQTLQSHAGAYAYILEVISDIQNTRQN